MRYIGLLVDPLAREGYGGYMVSEEFSDYISYMLRYEPEFHYPIKINLYGWKRCLGSNE